MVTLTETISGALRRPTSYEGVWGWITTVDHKRIGILYGVTAFIFFLLAGIEALIMRVQLSGPQQDLVSPEIFSQLFTMHALSMIFLAIMPMGAAFFNYMIPLMIGARDVAFPRMNALSYWLFLGGGIVLNSGWLAGGISPDTGWFAYANLTEEPYTLGNSMDFYTVGLGTLGTASMIAAFNFIVTIVNMRAPGMSLMRMPVFVWMTLVTSLLIMLAMPVITVGLIELYMDRNFGFNFFDPVANGDPILWQHIFWVFGHPEVYILILPAMGIVTEIIPTFSRKPLFGYPVVVLSGVIIGFLGWGVWSHHMFTVGLGPYASAAFAISTMIIAIPTGVKIFNWIATMWGGQIKFTTPMLFAIGFIILFIVGGLSGIMHSSAPSDNQQQDTYFVVAHIHYVLFGGAIWALFGGIYYWWPKFTGTMLSEGLGKLHFWVMLLGMNLTFFPMHNLGMDGMPRRIYTYAEGMGWDNLNLLATVGAFLMASSTLIFIHNAFRSLRKGEKAPNDPWDARTLEWSISSPPPHYNFKEIPTVHSRDAFWEEKYGAGNHQEGLEPVAGGSPDADDHDHHSEGHGDGHDGGHGIHMPGLSYWPFMVAGGMTVAAYGAIFQEATTWALGAIGMFMAMVAVYAWSFEPASEPEEPDE